MYEYAKNYRANFLRKHGRFEYFRAGVRRPGIRIEIYDRDCGDKTVTVVVVVDDKDRRRVPFDHMSRVEGYIGSKVAISWFSEYCNRYGVKGTDVDRALKRLWSAE